MKTRPSKAKTNRREKLRDQHWKEIDPALLWDRKQQKGFTTIPRTLPLIMRIMDEMAGKGRPISSTFLALWCQMRDECVVEIENIDLMAYQAGFSGQRGRSTWEQRMHVLKQLGFIDARAQVNSEFAVVLIFNPHLVIRRYWEQQLADDRLRPRINRTSYEALLEVVGKWGNQDFDEPEEFLEPSLDDESDDLVDSVDTKGNSNEP